MLMKLLNILINNKNAFQWDVYRPLQWLSDGDWGCLPGGVCPEEGVCPRGVSPYGDVYPGGVCLGGVCLPPPGQTS